MRSPVAGSRVLIDQFYPNSFAGALLDWFRADNIHDVQYGDSIYWWRDEGLLTSNMASGGSPAPVLQANEANGRPAISLLGSASDYLISRTLPQASNYRSVFAVFRARTGTTFPNAASIIEGNGAVNYREFIKLNSGATTLNNQSGHFSIWVNGTQTNEFAPITTYKAVYSEVNQNTSMTQFVCGKDIGAAIYFDGFVIEFGIFNRVLTQTERNTLFEYLRSTYALY